MHHDFGIQLGEALLMAAGMFWDVGWSPVLGSPSPPSFIVGGPGTDATLVAVAVAFTTV